MTDEQLTEDERRLVGSVPESLAGARAVLKLLRIHDADKARLDGERSARQYAERRLGIWVERAYAYKAQLGRVRAILVGPHPTAFQPLVSSLRAALTNQPAPAASLGHPGADQVFAELQARRYPGWPALTTAEKAEANASVPGQAVQEERPADFGQTVRDALARELAAANARIAELEADREKWIKRADFYQGENRQHLNEVFEVIQKLDAANARVDEAERESEGHASAAASLRERVQRAETQLAQKLEAAERKLEKCFELSDSASEAYLELRDERDQLAQKLSGCHQENQRVLSERNQLAARVTEAERANAQLRGLLSRLDIPASEECTLAERKVLEASEKAPASELELVIAMPGHPTWEVEHAQAELANRAAKAKREAK